MRGRAGVGRAPPGRAHRTVMDTPEALAARASSGRRDEAAGAAGRARRAAQAGPGADERYQDEILPGVSRTFALTIPQLPGDLRRVVTNNYLLCRIADTVEDDPRLTYEEKRRFTHRFADCVAGVADGEAFARELAPRLAPGVLAAELDLVQHAARVLRVTHSFNPRQRAALTRCLRIMCEGMERFQRFEAGRARGLADLDELASYCYHVAGVVGETLTELFCDHSRELEAQRDELRRLSVSFGQGLQMTNILKDVWDDRDRGFCWLPREVFERAGFDLAGLDPERYDPAFGRGLAELIGVARGHLRDALTYTLMIPRSEVGIRRFCLWALGMAVLTLRKIHRRPSFSRSAEVKITRRTVRATVAASNLCVRRDRTLRLLFAAACAGLPQSIPVHAAS